MLFSSAFYSQTFPKSTFEFKLNRGKLDLAPSHADGLKNWFSAPYLGLVAEIMLLNKRFAKHVTWFVV